MDNNITKGPWIYREVLSKNNYKDLYAHSIFSEKANKVVIIDRVNKPEDVNNFRLMSAAPEMYELLKIASQFVKSIQLKSEEPLVSYTTEKFISEFESIKNKIGFNVG